MTVNPLTLNAMLAAERKAENEAWHAINETTPNTPGHVAAHGFWMRHRGRRELLEELVAEARAARRQLTTISGYWLDSVAVIDPPQPDICPYCATGPCVAMCEPPADERVYLAAWRDGDFDDDLVGYAEALWHVGYERLLGGAE